MQFHRTHVDGNLLLAQPEIPDLHVNTPTCFHPRPPALRLILAAFSSLGTLCWLSCVSFSGLLCMLSGSQSINCSVSAEAGVAAEITATQSVCIEQSLNPTRVLRKLNAKRSFTTTQLKERTMVLELSHVTEKMFYWCLVGLLTIESVEWWPWVSQAVQALWFRRKHRMLK